MARPESDAKTNVSLSPLTSRIPPHNIEAEQSILGSILVEPDALLRVSDSLTAADFYREDHRVIYEHMLKLFEKRKPIDLLTLTDALESSKKLAYVGGATYIATLTSLVNSSVHIVHHSDIVRNKAMLRKLITAGSKIAELGFKEDSEAAEILDQAESSLFGVSQVYLSNNFVPIGAILSESFDRIDELHKNKGALRGVTTGYKILDNLLGGLQKSDLIIVAARPSMGKCVTGDTEILNPKTGELKTIESLVKEKTGEVVTLDASWRSVETTPENYVADGVKPTYKVETALGREIEATLPHPFLTITGWKKLAELTVGDRIGVPKSLPYFGTLEEDDYKLKSLAYFIADGSLTQSCPTFTNINSRIVADFHSAITEFGGVVVHQKDSQGTRAPSYVVSINPQAYNDSKQSWSHSFNEFALMHRSEVRAATRAIGLSSANLTQWRKGDGQPSFQTWTQFRTHLPDFPQPKLFSGLNPVRTFLEEQGVWNKTAHDKTIPSSVFQLTKPKLSLFLNRLYACDGCAYTARCGGQDFPVIAYASVSKKLAQQVQHLLLRFGILAKLRQRKVKYRATRRTAYEVEIHGRENLLNFIEQIGIFGKEEAIARVKVVATKHRAGWTKDTLPVEIWTRILQAKGDASWRSVYKKLGLPLSHNIHANQCSPRRETVQKLACIFEDRELEAIAESEVYWDKIVSIEPTGNKPVYDLTIAQTHNFIANDFIVHNTTLALNIAENAAIQAKAKVGVFSLEQSKDQLVDRLLCSQAGVDTWKLRTGNLTDEDFPKIGQAMGILSEASIFIDDSPGQSALEIMTKSRRLQMEQGLDLVVIDYLQLMRGRNSENRTQEVSDISRSLKVLARELNVPVIALSQLSRAVESRPDKRPLLSDLRESGSLEQDADVVMFIYRDEYYDKDSERKNIAEILVRKHRNGPVGEVDLYFAANQSAFRNLDKRSG